MKNAYRIQQHLKHQKHILCHWCRKEEEVMRETDDPRADLDDLIFEEGDGGPSER